MTSKVIIITAPSGSGKTTLVKYLLHKIPELTFSISACTRAPRKGEVNGKDYHFLTTKAFRDKMAKKGFLEWEMVYPGKYYGTPVSEIERIWKSGKIPLIDIDVQGAGNVKNKFRGDSFSVFIKAPSMHVLKQRLKQRGTETTAGIKERISKAELELKYAKHFDYILVNDDLETAREELFNQVTSFLKK